MRPAHERAGVEEVPVRIALDPFVPRGTVVLPPAPTGIVLFAHGSGLTRPGRSSRGLARQLERAGLGTALLDLLTSDEERFHEIARRASFDLDLLAGRVAVATDWLRNDPRTGRWPLGYFGRGAGAPAAVMAATERAGDVRAVVCWDGRLDLAGAALAAVRAPVLLLAGAHDPALIDLNRRALEMLPLPRKRLEVLSGARRRREELGGELAAEWFRRQLTHSS